MDSAPVRNAYALLAASALALLAGCASSPRPLPASASTSPSPSVPTAPAAERDGPLPNPPPDLAAVPDAQPVVEAILPGGPNKPYEVLGQSYTPITQDRAYAERGVASWYGRKFHGRRTASGEVYNMYAMSAAHRTLPLPSYARVRNPANGREVVLRVNDRGPFHKGRVIDLSYAAAVRLGLQGGVGPVEIERITYEDIRTGAWTRGATAPVLATAPAGPAAAPGGLAVAAVAAPPAPPAGSGFEVVAVPAELGQPVSLATTAAPSSEPAKVSAASAEPPRGFWLQLGAFRQREGAEGFQQRVAAEVDWLAPMLAVVAEAGLYRLQAGPYANREDARGGAERVRTSLQLVPVVVERR